MTSMLTRVSLAASSLFDPTASAAPQQVRFAFRFWRVYWNLHRFPTSIGRRNVARSLFYA